MSEFYCCFVALLVGLFGIVDTADEDCRPPPAYCIATTFPYFNCSFHYGFLSKRLGDLLSEFVLFLIPAAPPDDFYE